MNNKLPENKIPTSYTSLYDRDDANVQSLKKIIEKMKKESDKNSIIGEFMKPFVMQLCGLCKTEIEQLQTELSYATSDPTLLRAKREILSTYYADVDAIEKELTVENVK